MCRRIEFNNGWSHWEGRDALYVKFVYDMFATSNGSMRRPKVDKYMNSSQGEEFIEFEIDHESVLKLKESIEEYLEEKLFQDLKKKEDVRKDST